VMAPHVFTEDGESDDLIEGEDVQPRDPRDFLPREEACHAFGAPEVRNEAGAELHQQRADTERIQDRDVNREKSTLGQPPRAAPGGEEDRWDPANDRKRRELKQVEVQHRLAHLTRSLW